MKKHSRRNTPLEGGGSVDQCWAGSLAPTLDTNHDYEAHDYDYDYHYRRSSVLSKVKDKAMIWKRISTRRNSYNDASTPEWGVSLQDEFDDDDNDPDDQPKWRSIPEIYQRHVLEDKPTKSNQHQQDNRDQAPTTLTRTVTRTLTAPVYAVASGAQMIASMLQDVVVSGTALASTSLHQIIDKRSSVSKGNVVENKDGREEEKRVCGDEVRKGGELAKKGANEEELNTAVRDKVREAVSSIIENQLLPSTRNNQQVSGDEDHLSQRILQTN
ncbi:hypothetical protein Sjap_001821 [Stephania japonica]|uniref:Uncharacterized protein n=1 Tax=Stephania japonica TaxID=461633 RepID=A0AAP0KKN4_9MAGN